MSHDHRKCEDEDDAARMAESILRSLGYVAVQRGSNVLDVRYEHDYETLRVIAQHGERIARWARAELRERFGSHV